MASVTFAGNLVSWGPYCPVAWLWAEFKAGHRASTGLSKEIWEVRAAGFQPSFLRRSCRTATAAGREAGARPGQPWRSPPCPCAVVPGRLAPTFAFSCLPTLSLQSSFTGTDRKGLSKDCLHPCHFCLYLDLQKKMHLKAIIGPHGFQINFPINQSTSESPSPQES